MDLLFHPILSSWFIESIFYSMLPLSGLDPGLRTATGRATEAEILTVIEGIGPGLEIAIDTVIDATARVPGSVVVVIRDPIPTRAEEPKRNNVV